MQVYEAIREELATGGRAYIICPLVSDSGAEGMSDIKAGSSLHATPVDLQQLSCMMALLLNLEIAPCRRRKHDGTTSVLEGIAMGCT